MIFVYILIAFVVINIIGLVIFSWQNARRSVKPKLIVNVAISGSVQYQIGMNGAACIVSINKAAGSPIFDISHYGAVADFKSLVPAMTAEISAAVTNWIAEMRMGLPKRAK